MGCPVEFGGPGGLSHGMAVGTGPLVRLGHVCRYQNLYDVGGLHARVLVSVDVIIDKC